MSQYYNPRRKSYLYTPGSLLPFSLSRSKLDLFLNCPRCFYFDRRLGVAQPPGFPFSLNSAVDKLLKKEFDIHRADGTPHPLMKTYKIDVIPLKDKNMDKWRDALRGGIEYLHQDTKLNITGGIDDIWVNPAGEFIIVDYKATSKTGDVSLDADWQIGYKRQMEIYQWLFRKNGYKVSSTGYFVYCNGDADAKAFDGKLEFDVRIIPYVGDDSWVEKIVIDIHKCLNGKLPDSGKDCDYCKYREAINDIFPANQAVLF